jgi:glycosyltransferase involved in cell wall biosynthesis
MRVAQGAPERVVEIACRSSVRLCIAAKLDNVDTDYYKPCVEPLLDNALIEFIGEIGDGEKGALLGDATALLFAIGWPEPFGLVRIEAMATGAGDRCSPQRPRAEPARRCRAR